MQRVKLLCVPYAGGSASLFNKWRPFIDPSIELIPIELAGRGRRFKEPFYETFNEAVQDVYQQIKGYIEDGCYALFGHSMGSWLAYEVYYAIRRAGGNQPLHLFVSGRQAPQLESDTNYSGMADSDFINVLRAFGGTPDEILDNPYILDVILPILKNDFQMIENYKFVEKDESIACDMTILTGRSDNNIRFEDLLLWKKLSDCSSHIYEMNGGHFFITEYPEDVTKVINQVLSAKSLNSSGGRTV
ncbi:thioesterase II family protein [Paenibacillus durus]|uniref:Thioesterase domain-containing protein n=1 Tax=Paenibacillus durus ATCC 35681 TaxID=1333534 RepID=A0A0F7FAB3_PAEDU|nr:thioesterase domain-containing protein [Paenibacillus durus]AKG35479.1 hypothetical protein VK70_13605 [Paenibacillus durus ATCC 35681]